MLVQWTRLWVVSGTMNLAPECPSTITVTRESSLRVLTKAKSKTLDTGHVLALAVSLDDNFLMSLCCRHSLHVHVDPLYDCHFVAMITPDVGNTYCCHGYNSSCPSLRGVTWISILSCSPQVSGGGDKVVHVWSADACTNLHTFSRHRGTVMVRGRELKRGGVVVRV